MPGAVDASATTPGVAYPNLITMHNGTTEVLRPTTINAYSVLAIPAYGRAIHFLSSGHASFPQSVHKDAAKLEPPHVLDKWKGRRLHLVDVRTRSLATSGAVAGPLVAPLGWTGKQR